VAILAPIVDGGHVLEKEADEVEVLAVGAGGVKWRLRVHVLHGHDLVVAQ
jgi:hypothetical protein